MLFRRSMLVLLVITSSASAQQSPASLVADIKAIGKEGQGHAAAMKAMKMLTSSGQTSLPAILSGLDDATPLAANWLRSAFESAIDRDVAAGKKIDLAPLAAFLNDKSHAGPARRLAYETIVRFDPSAQAKLAPTFLDDPGSELRRDAVELVIKDAEKALAAKSDDALPLFKKALNHARDKDQVILAAEKLKKLGVDTDLVSHFGFITRWSLIGSFDNVKGVGFKNVYPPEKAVDLKAEHVGKDDEKIAWKPHETKAAYGVVDLNKVFGPLHGTTAFGYAVIESPKERPIEVRCGSNNAVRIFLNGKEIYAREEYHHGMQMDQHVGKGILKAGQNTILIKCLQNEQTDSWAQQWSFQVRLCDHLGGAVPFEQK